MSELCSIAKIDEARSELLRHGIKLDSFELMRGRIDALEDCLRECVYCLEHDVTVERSMNLLDKARALLEEK